MTHYRHFVYWILKEENGIYILVKSEMFCCRSWLYLTSDTPNVLGLAHDDNTVIMTMVNKYNYDLLLNGWNQKRSTKFKPCEVWVCPLMRSGSDGVVWFWFGMELVTIWLFSCLIMFLLHFALAFWNQTYVREMS